jgi:1,4-dihydroxy-2-naphthoate octaprenyltransferase
MTTPVSGKSSTFAAYINALRPKTLSAAITPALAGTFLAPVPYSQINWTLFFSLVFTFIFLQLGTNLINDACDFEKGADTLDRLGPQRLVQKGLLTARQVFAGGFICFFFSVLCAIPFLIKGGRLFGLFLALSIMAGYFYTAGPFPLAYKGFGELFVILFFGLMATVSAYFFQTGDVSPMIVVTGLQIGLFATVLIAINNLRDIAQDRKANKLTLAARLGLRAGRTEILLCLIIPYLLNLLWLPLGNMTMAVMPFMTFPMALNIIRNIYKHEPGYIYNKLLQEAGFLHISFGLLLVIAHKLS